MTELQPGMRAEDRPDEAALALAAAGRDVLRGAALVSGASGGATVLLLGLFVHDEIRGAVWLVIPLGLFGFAFATASFASGWTYLALEARLAARPRPGPMADTAVPDEPAARARRFDRLAFVAALAAMAATVAGFLASAWVLVALLA